MANFTVISACWHCCMQQICKTILDKDIPGDWVYTALSQMKRKNKTWTPKVQVVPSSSSQNAHAHDQKSCSLIAGHLFGELNPSFLYVKLSFVGENCWPCACCYSLMLCTTHLRDQDLRCWEREGTQSTLPLGEMKKREDGTLSLSCRGQRWSLRVKRACAWSALPVCVCWCSSC